MFIVLDPAMGWILSPKIYVEVLILRISELTLFEMGSLQMWSLG